MSIRKSDEASIRKINPFGLRLLPDLKQRLEDAAAAHVPPRSLNSEIAARLEASLRRDVAEADERRQIERLGMVASYEQSGGADLALEITGAINAAVAAVMERHGHVVHRYEAPISSAEQRAPDVPPAKAGRRRKSPKA